MLNQFRKPNKRELIAGGDVLWKPIDKQAAMMLSKSNNQINTENIMSKSLIPHNHKYINGICEECKEKEAVKYGKDIITHSENVVDEAVDFAEQVKTAKKRLYDAVDGFRDDVAQFVDAMPKTLEKVRAWRMTVEREVQMSVRALEDLRKFFLNDQHEKEMARLNEFVRTCERLQALSDNGTLNAVADVMLKLA